MPKNAVVDPAWMRGSTSVDRFGNPVESAPLQSNAAEGSVVDLSENNELSQRVDGVFGAEKYKRVRDYILGSLGDQPFRLSDGTVAVVDRSDALHIANKSGTEKQRKYHK